MSTDNITDKNTLKSWFKRGLKPLEAQFHAWMDSYWHKEEKLPTSSVEGLEKILNNKAEESTVDELSKVFNKHEANILLHKTENEQAKLNNLADNPNMTYATNQDLLNLRNNPNVIIIPADFIAGYNSLEIHLKAAVAPYFENGTFFTKPVFLEYIYKKDYTKENEEEYHLLVAGVPYYNGTERGVRFRSNSKIADTDYPDTPMANDISIYVNIQSKDIQVALDEYRPEINTVVAIENHIFQPTDKDGVILSLCRGLKKVLQAIETGKEYSLFYNLENSLVPGYFEKKEIPKRRTVILKTGFNAVREMSGIYFFHNYFLETSEFEYTEGMDLPTITATIENTITGINADKLDGKHASEFVLKTAIPSVYLVTEYPTDLTHYPEGSIFIKQ